ncbi:transglycosylase domain-containing protein [Dictyobacter aurantiacus]|uniref:transglycosylase domain-containing protein n=1 Tax=Dictyobacter aurantiacus TaxID=1936993 RepID=UPI0013582E17|nr:transglycosylase domain-containing protein [Dictyobacter aurantiacus]
MRSNEDERDDVPPSPSDYRDTIASALEPPKVDPREESVAEEPEPPGELEEKIMPVAEDKARVLVNAKKQRKPSMSDNGHREMAAMVLADEFDAGSSRRVSSAEHRLNGNHIMSVTRSRPNRELARRSAIAVADPYSSRRSRERMLQRRKRVNRVLMHKRHHSRFYDTLLLRLMSVALVLFALLLILTSGASGAAYAYYQAQLPLLDGIAQHSLAQTTNIYDRNGKLLYQLYDHSSSGGRRTYVNFEDIPNELVNATIAAEDHSFWNNSGVDYNGIVRAVITNFQHGSVQEGGSTVTQQLIKNQFFLDQDRTLQVKGEEAILATGLTQRYSKAQIMEMYLNTVFYGDSNFGVEAAAQDYFGLKPQCKQGVCKPAVAQLTLGQASLLAGLPQSPTGYMPFTNKKAAMQRQTHVLQNMLSLKMITSDQMQVAQKEIANYKFKRPAYVKNAPHFVDYIVDNVLIPLFGAYNLRNGGYSIYTTLDLDLERQVEKIVYNRIDGNEFDIYGYGNLRTAHNLHNASVVVTDPKTGEILAMDGSVNYNDTSNDPAMSGQYNAANTLRPPGSSFKPVVYATAFEMGWYPAMNVPDHNTYYPDGTKPYNPPNYDHKFHGDNMTIRRGISNSYNIPAVDAIEYAGVKNVMTMAGRLGLSHVAQTVPGRQGAAMALGVSEETLLNMTTAYATFANGGVRMPQTTVLQINDNQGRPIYKFDARHARGKRVLGADVSFLISSMLSDTVARHEEFPSPNPLELDGRPVAAKTGTTDNFADNWTMGYTPHLAVGVWAGNSDNSPMENVIGITGAGPIWQDVFQYANAKYHFPKDGFTPPPNVHQATVSAYTGLLPHLGEATVTDWFIDGTVPTIQGVYTPPPPVKAPKTGKPTQNPGDNGNVNGNTDNNNSNTDNNN